MNFKDWTEILLDSKSEVNIISQAFTLSLDLRTRKTNVGAQKIDSTTLKTYGIIVSTFAISDKDGRKRFVEENFLLANVELDVVFGMLFLTISNANINFQARNLQWRFYITEDVLWTTKRVEQIGKKEFATTALNPIHKTFIIYIAVLNISSDISDKVYPSRKDPIAYLKADKAPIEVSIEYANFVVIF